MKIDKLVRDRIDKIIRRNGRIPVTHVASEEEYNRKLKAKLVEEAEEFIKSNSIEELADLLQVIYTLLDHMKIPREELEAKRRAKNEEVGRFSDRIILDEVKEESR